MEFQQFTIKAKQIKENIEKVIVGKSATLDLVLTALFAGGHVLLEDVPGTGKTVLAKSLAKSVDASFKRIQFTPDLLPTDITGLNVYNQKENAFVFRQGPVFAHMILADEINRATPRTQSGLLECMEERQVTIDGELRKMATPFFVIATQNPIETAGTFPLPEAQMDRFMMRLSVGVPTFAEEQDMLQRFLKSDPLKELQAVCTAEDLVEMQETVKEVFVHSCVQQYLLKIITATRACPEFMAGVSPRGSLALMRAAQSFALLQGRTYVLPEDVKYLAAPVLSHRVVMKSTWGDRADADQKISAIVGTVPVPTENFSGE